MDEIPVYLNMPPSTVVEKVGKREVRIKKQDQESVRISCALTVFASCDKLHPFLIFKAKNKGKVEAELQKHKAVVEKKIIVVCQDNAWMDEKSMEYWIRTVWKTYGVFKLKKDTLLILDSLGSHKTPGVKELFKEMKSKLVVVPGGLTCKLQPLDRSINKPFKDALKKRYTEYCIEECDSDAKVKREKVIDWITQIW